MRHGDAAVCNLGEDDFPFLLGRAFIEAATSPTPPMQPEDFNLPSFSGGLSLRYCGHTVRLNDDTNFFAF